MEGVAATQPSSNPDFPKEQKKIAIIGAGFFGTCLAVVAARAGHEVYLYCRDEMQADTINTTHRNPKTFPEYALPELIRAGNRLEEALEDAILLMLCIPAQMVPDWLIAHKDQISPHLLICNTAKGLHLASKRLLSEAVRDALARDQPYALLSGPSFAKEIMDGYPTAGIELSS
jgi:glycerol-3-phosphate dehydrogenase